MDEDVDSHLHRRHELQLLFDNMPSLAAYWNSDIRNVVANAAYAEWFGLTPESIHGMHGRELLGDDLYASNLPKLEAVLKGEPQRFERSFLDASGAQRHTQISYVPDIVNGRVVGFFAYVDDVTAIVESKHSLSETQRTLARLNEELTIAHRFRGDMIAMLSHDARQPLTAMILLLDNLLDQWDEKEQS